MYTKLFTPAREPQHPTLVQFSWVSLIEALLKHNQPTSNNSYSLVLRIVNSLLSDIPLTHNIAMNKEFEHGIRDLQLGYVNNKTNETTKILKLLFFTSYLYKQEPVLGADDQINSIVSTLMSSSMGTVIPSLLNRISKLADLTDYDNYQDCGLSGGYDRMKINGWHFCCDLFLPVFNEWQNTQSKYSI